MSIPAHDESPSPTLTPDRTSTEFEVALGVDPDVWDAHLRELIEADGTTEVVAQYFIPESDPATSRVEKFTTRAEALAWLQEQYAAEHPAVLEPRGGGQSPMP